MFDLNDGAGESSVRDEEDLNLLRSGPGEQTLWDSFLIVVQSTTRGLNPAVLIH